MGKNTMRSLSVGDLFAKNDKSGGRRDPAVQQVDLMKDIRETLIRIERKPGGMTK
jgi:hypothetical protein